MIDVLVVGAGPAGLAAATAIRRMGDHRVRVLDREAQLGGVPRHCLHAGFGRELKRVLDGPTYARHRALLAHGAGVELSAETTALGWTGDGALVLETTSPRGLETLEARVVVLATGCRERPRAARLVPGTRPLGVYTTGALQQLVHLHGMVPGRRAVIVGAEMVSFSAARTLAGAGIAIAGMVTDEAAPQVAPWVLDAWPGLPITCGVTVARIDGARRVEAVQLSDGRTLACDTVVFTGAFIPDQELARAGGLVIDAGTRGPAVDQAYRSSRPGVLVAGNLLHGAELADRVAREGEAAARAVHRFLTGEAWPVDRVPLTAVAPLGWATPGFVTPGSDGQVLVRPTVFRAGARIEARQGGRLLHAERADLMPHLSHRLRGAWLGRVDPGAGPVELVIC